MSAPTSPSFVIRVTLCVWAAMIAVLGGMLAFKHEIPLEESALGNADLATTIARTRAASERGQWLAVHVLYEGCGCSARVLDSLLQHPAEPKVVERIVLVTDGALPESLKKAGALGYRTEVLSRADVVSRYGIEAAPSLALVSPTDSLRYVGGYTKRRRGPVIEDRSIVQRTLAGETVEPLPAFGCAVGKRLAARTEARLF